MFRGTPCILFASQNLGNKRAIKHWIFPLHKCIFKCELKHFVIFLLFTKYFIFLHILTENYWITNPDNLDIKNRTPALSSPPSLIFRCFPFSLGFLELVLKFGMLGFKTALRPSSISILNILPLFCIHCKTITKKVYEFHGFSKFYWKLNLVGG